MITLAPTASAVIDPDLRDVLEAIAAHDFERPCRRCGSMLRWALAEGLAVRGAPDEPLFLITAEGEQVIA